MPVIHRNRDSPLPPELPVTCPSLTDAVTFPLSPERPVTCPSFTDAVTPPLPPELPCNVPVIHRRCDSPLPPELPANEGVLAEVDKAPPESVPGGVAGLRDSVLTHCCDSTNKLRLCICANPGAHGRPRAFL